MNICIRNITVLATSLLLSGCVLAPKQAAQELRQAKTTGEHYEPPREKRTLPELPEHPTWHDVLRRAFYANGDLEAAYWEWRAALARVDASAAWPNSNIQLGFDYMFSSGRMKTFDRISGSAGFSSGAPLMMPFKVSKAGEIAFQQALGARERFADAKFSLQQKVLSSWWDYALMAERIRIEQDNVALLKMISDLAADRVRAGAPQQDMVKAQMEHRLAENNLATMQSELVSMRAMINGMLARKTDAPLPAPETLPEPRPLASDDHALIATGVDKNPELARLAHETQGRRDALKLAKMAYIPDVSPTAGFTGSAAQALGGMVMLPTAIPVINSQIRESKVMLRSSEAMLAQARHDRAASYVATLAGLRDAERQAKLFDELIIPKARQVIAASREAYAAGRIGFVELVDSQRTLLDARSTLAQARMTREKRLAELEALAGVDAETVRTPATKPSEQ